MRHKFLIIALAVSFFAACSGAFPATESPTDTPIPVMVEPTKQPLPRPLNNEFLPESADANFSRGEVFMNSTDMLIMESYPIQVALLLQGELPTPCNHLRVIATPPDDQNRIEVEVYSVLNPAENCIQAIEPFEANIMLGSFENGHYSVFVNGEKVGEFDA